MTSLTPSRAKERLSYDPETGEIRWRTHVRKQEIGQLAGGIDHSTGYLRIRVDDVLYYGHRLAWLLQTGEWPIHQIDHIDHNKLNIRWSNLRAATQQQNLKNMPKSRSNTSGFKGVHFARHANRWRAEIIADGKRHRLGYFPTAKDAADAYNAAARRLHGDFAAPNQ